MVQGIFERGLTRAGVAAEAGVSHPTARKWLGRFLALGRHSSCMRVVLRGARISSDCRLGAALLLSLAGLANAGLREGLEAVAAKDYERVYVEMKPLADNGNPIAQEHIGWLFAIGKSVPKNDIEAIKWLELAAHGNVARAQSRLGAYYVEGGDGIPKDFAAARRWYELAAKQGDEVAYLGLADIYERGLGVDASPGIARQWARKAAEVGFPRAQFLLGVRYWQGRGADRNMDEAHAWFLRAANQNHASAMVSLGMMHLGDGRPYDPQLACKWLKIAQQVGVSARGTRRLALTVQQRCDSLTPNQRKEIDKLVAEWKPNEAWRELKMREFQDLLNRAGEEDAQRRNKAR